MERVATIVLLKDYTTVLPNRIVIVQALFGVSGDHYTFPRKSL